MRGGAVMLGNRCRVGERRTGTGDSRPPLAASWHAAMQSFGEMRFPAKFGTESHLAAGESARDTLTVVPPFHELTMSLQELESAVTQLPADELTAFSRWFEEYLADAWDRRIEADIPAGRLDEAGQRADAEFEAGRCRPL